MTSSSGIKSAGSREEGNTLMELERIGWERSENEKFA